MNLTQTDTPLFGRLRFVLVETSRPGNIGATARAMKNMGFSELVLVNSRFDDLLAHKEALAFASGAQDILANALIVESLKEALAGCNFAAAVSARLRVFSPPVLTPRRFAARLYEQADLHAAVVFGNERFGLPNEAIQHCNVLINIPTNPDYSSLNLAQAVQVISYEARMGCTAEDSSTAESAIRFQREVAGRSQVEGMFAHLEQALIAIDFLDPDNPKKLMPRLKRLFARTELETEEVNILRGIASQILTASKRIKSEGINQ